MPRLSPDTPHVHPDCLIADSTFGAYCEVGAGSRIINATFADYAYCDRLSDIANTTVGKFANIAAMTRIGPTDHPMANASLHHFLYRSSCYWDDATDDPPFSPGAKRAAPCWAPIAGSVTGRSSGLTWSSAQVPWLRQGLSSPGMWPPM